MALSMGKCQCDAPEEPVERPATWEQVSYLAGQPQQFVGHTRSADRPGRRALVVAGLVGDLPGISDALDSVRSFAPVSGRLTLIPRVNVNAVRIGRRSVGGDLTGMFGTDTPPPTYRAVVTELQTVADTSDILLVLTDQVDDVGHSLYYSDDATAATMQVADQIAGAINQQLGRLSAIAGVDFDDIYALRTDRPNTFVAWAGRRAHPSLALELAMFGGREPNLARERQMLLARLATTVALVELGVLDRSALDRILERQAPSPPALPPSVPGQPPPPIVDTAPLPDTASFPSDVGLRYLVNGRVVVHRPGDLWAVPSGATVRPVEFSGAIFDGIAVDLIGVGGDNDMGRTVSMPSTEAGAVEIRYLSGSRHLWSELLLVGGAAPDRMILQDSLGTNPWISGFPESESWLFLSETRLTGQIAACASCDLPATIRLLREDDRLVVGSNRTLRIYGLVLDGATVGRLIVPRWDDDAGEELVDLTEINDRFGLTPGVVVNMKYATTDNFLNADVYGGINRCLLKREVAEALARVQQTLSARGLGLKVFDCYRPHPVQYRMWEIRPEPGYVAPPERGSNHNRGAAVDLTLVGADGQELSMPTAYDDFTPLAWHETTEGLTPEQIDNRRTLLESMKAEGFSTIRKEWWHYNGPGHRRYTVNMSVPLGSSQRRMPFPPDWRALRLTGR